MAHDFTSKVRLNHRCAAAHRAAALRLLAHPGIFWETLAWVCPTKATDYKHSDRKGSTSGVAMIRATVVCALVLTAAFAAAATPATCLGGDSDQLPAKATKEFFFALLSLLRQNTLSHHSPILV